MTNPYEVDTDPEDDRRETCDACRHPFEDDETLVIIGHARVHQGCAALCSGCSELGIANLMLRIGAAHWVHEDCVAAPHVIEARYRALKADEDRDDFNITRR